MPSIRKFCNHLDLKRSFGMSIGEESGCATPSTLRYLMIIPIIFTLFARQSLASSMCQYSKQKGLLAADCAHQNLVEVPTDIRPETEVLDLSTNYIQRLEANAFERCTSIKLLYLQYNAIFKLDSQVFTPLTSLTVLDLSRNVVMNLPYLPGTLQKLYLNYNPAAFTTQDDPMQRISSLTSLDTLHLSGNDLKQFPKFREKMPSLVKLNISNNKIGRVDVEDLAGLCQLKFLYMELVPVDKDNISEDDYCSCVRIQSWMDQHGIQGTTLNCLPPKYTEVQCDLTTSNQTQEIYQKCMEIKDSREKPHSLILAGCLIALLVVLIVLFYVQRRRRAHEERINLSANKKNCAPTIVGGLDDKTMEEKCTNPAFDSCRIQHVNTSHVETAV